jgi:hypothetical protein
LFNVWRSSGADPYRLYNGLDESYRPLHDPSLPPRPPQFPERVRAFVYACGARARELEVEDRNLLIRGIAKALGG